ncbi:hypothetical protein TcWFU_005925 [Taenia crassiceps]|uniref:Uncharacterized protein n=1 Tax=Taenia crassiceps TaxID=6207 RepID=A0ABR4Q2D6_9CEST
MELASSQLTLHPNHLVSVYPAYPLPNLLFATLQSAYAHAAQPPCDIMLIWLPSEASQPTGVVPQTRRKAEDASCKSFHVCGQTLAYGSTIWRENEQVLIASVEMLMLLLQTRLLAEPTRRTPRTTHSYFSFAFLLPTKFCCTGLPSDYKTGQSL